MTFILEFSVSFRASLIPERQKKLTLSRALLYTPSSYATWREPLSLKNGYLEGAEKIQIQISDLQSEFEI